MTKRIFFDGLNLALPKGTGIATYTRVLAQAARELGYQTGVLYSSRRKPSRDPMLREIGFFDERRVRKLTDFEEASDFIDGHVRGLFPAKTVAMPLNGVVVARQFEHQLPDLDYRYLAHRLFDHARYRFALTGGFTPVDFDVRPDIMHCTYQLPLRAKAACNVYTIHDLVPLRLPFTTLDNKRQSYDLLKKIGREADHIVTVSESSRRDIIEILGVDEKRVTNTYEAVSFPHDPRSDDDIAEQLSGVLGLSSRGYLLFFGALEPKKNIDRIIDAYLTCGADIPLVMVTSQGWGNDALTKRLLALKASQDPTARRRIIHYEYVSRAMLITLIRGARAVLFPSLYEGFGLPVLEAMALGTPVLTSANSSLTEVAGDAAVLVDPYETADIARGITTIAHDADLRAELVRRGHAQAELFSLGRYRERLKELYSTLA